MWRTSWTFTALPFRCSLVNLSFKFLLNFKIFSTSKNDERNENSKKEENNHNISTNLNKIFKKEIINSKEKCEENKRSNTNIIRPSSARSSKILNGENNYRMQNSF